MKHVVSAAAIWIVAGSLLAYAGYHTYLPSFRRWSQAPSADHVVDTGL